MDSQERHELQQNDLVEFLTHFREWWRNNGTFTLLTILVVVLAYFGYRHLVGREMNHLNAAWAEREQVQNPDGLFRVADKYPDLPMLSAKARLQGADLLLREAIFGRPSDPDAVALAASDPQWAVHQMERAAREYEKIIADGEPGIVVVHARLSLAAIAETRGLFDEAEAQYRAARNESIALGAPRLTSRVDRKIEDLPRLQQYIFFPSNPIQPQPPDLSMPDLAPDAGDMDVTGGLAPTP